MNDIRPEGYLSIIEFAHVCDCSEGRVRALLGEGKLPSVKLGLRRWIPEVAVIERFADMLALPATRNATLARLRANAEAARVELSPDDELVANAEAYLRGENPRVDTPEPDPWATPTPVAARQSELVPAGD